MNLRHGTLALSALLMTGTAIPAMAETVRWSRSGDALTVDPHAQNEGPTNTLNQQIHEPLVLRDMESNLVPALATDWGVSEENENVWVFNLREGVVFHDGAEFTADDAVFSLNRAMSENSNFRELLSSVVEVRATDDYTLEIETNGPNPILPANLTNTFMMDRGWAEENGATDVQNYAGGEDTFASRNANGTGPYRIVSREPDVRTVMEAFPDYWGADEFALDVTRIDFTPIQNAATRVAAMLSGELDFIQDVPVQDLERVDAQDGLDVRNAPQNRVIFFGLDVASEDIESDDVEGANPFADVRVREAMNVAIDRNAIQRVVMRDQSIPAGVIAPPFVNGWTEELDQLPEGDIEAAQALMEEAGYGDGFSVTLDCPNDRYINDEGICQAAVGMMGRIGIDVQLAARPRSQHFPMIANGETDFYMLGWGVPTFDSEYIFNFLVHTRTDNYGSWNGTGYSNPELDAQIEGLASETDTEVRNESIAQIWDVVQSETIYLPIHHQILNWGIRSDIGTPVSPDDQPLFKYFTIGAQG